MKQIILLFIIFCSICTSAQDTLRATDGRVIIGVYSGNYDDGVIMVDTKLVQHYVPYLTIASTSFIVKKGTAHVKLRNHSGNYLRKAGTYGILSVVLTVGGVLSTTLGAVYKQPALVYTGSGLSGAGFLLIIPAWYQVSRAGHHAKWEP